MELITPGLGLSFWMLVSFLLLFLLLKKFAWPVILKMLKERESSINNALNAAEKARQELIDQQSENQQLFEKAKAEREAILRDAKAAGKEIVEQAKTEALKEYNKLLKEAKDSLSNEKMAALSDIKNEIATLSIFVAEKILQEKFKDADAQKELIEKTLDEIRFN